MGNWREIVSFWSDAANAIATGVGGAVRGITTVTSGAAELIGEGLGAVVGLVSEQTGESIKRSGRVVANVVRVPGCIAADGIKTASAFATGLVNYAVGNEGKASELGDVVNNTIDDACETVTDGVSRLCEDVYNLIPPMRGSFQKFCQDHVKPVPGSVVCCDLAVGLEHSGVYIGDGMIVHRDGEGYLAIVDRNEFVQRLGGYNPSTTIFVSCEYGRPVGSACVAERAREAMKIPCHARGYGLLTKNCHQFCQYCLTGQVNNGAMDFTFANLEAVLNKYYSANSWRVMQG